MNLKTLIENNYYSSIQHRRYLHQHPELSLCEEQTSIYIAKELDALGIPYQTNIGGFGVVGLIEGEYEGPTILIRADMDALPINEETELPFQSRVPNVMHACGHDIHTANLLNTAKILLAFKKQMHGNVKLVFQPAEEGHDGAKHMIADGILNNPQVDYAIGLHIDPHLLLGSVAIEDGPITAFPQFFEVKLYGRGGHGSVPFDSIDPLRAGVHFFQMVNDLHKEINPLHPHVIQFGSIQAGDAPAVIPDLCILRGTVRTHFEEDRLYIQKRIFQILDFVASIYNVKTSINYIGSEKPVFNDPYYAEIARNTVKDIFDKGLVSSVHFKMVGEDFASFSHIVPSTFLVLGCSSNLDTIYPLHNAKFNPSEEVLYYATYALAKITLDYLKVVNY